MLCVVKDDESGKIIPSCSAYPEEGMMIETDTDEIRELRRTALELLLSEHLGDCEAPCRRACPAFLDIPLMISLINENRFNDAAEVVFRNIPLPSVLGRICPAPCEKACRRGKFDSQISICLLKRFVGDYVIENEALIPFGSAETRTTGQVQPFKAAVIGAGPAGLSAAFHLAISGVRCSIFEKKPIPGGQLLSILDDRLDKKILGKEIDKILQSGIELRTGADLKIDDLLANFAVVIVCAGEHKSGEILFPELEMSEHGIKADFAGRTSKQGVFAAGGCVRPIRMAAQAIGQGRKVAEFAIKFLEGEEIVHGQIFNSSYGTLSEDEINTLASLSSKSARTNPEDQNSGFDESEALEESSRCFQCQCLKKDACKLRDYSSEYDARQKRLHEGVVHQRLVREISEKLNLVYESGKCIKCGICVRISRKNQEKLGMAFNGKGIDTVLKVPFSESIEKGLENSADECARNCPTGAISKRTSEIYF